MNIETGQLIEVLSRIAIALESQPKPAPDIIMNIKHYPSFDWASIGAEVIEKDKHGAIAVGHGGKVYTRRNPVNKFGIAIWYSRANGKDGEDTLYERLITFKEIKIEADLLSEKTVALLKTFKQVEPPAATPQKTQAPKPLASANSIKPTDTAEADHKARLNLIRERTTHAGSQVGAIASKLLNRNLAEQPPTSEEVTKIRGALLVDWSKLHLQVTENTALKVLAEIGDGDDDEVCDRFIAAIEELALSGAKV